MSVDNPALVGLFAGVTVVAYLLAQALARRFRHPMMHPVPLSAALIIAVVYYSGHDFSAYRPVKDLSGWLLGPATVAMAVPVYHQRRRLRALALPMLAGVASGTVTTIAVALGLSAFGHLATPVRDTLVFKSITTPIAVELVKLHGGDASLVAIFVIFTGIVGAMVGPALLTRCHVHDHGARGIAMGTVSHALGTVAALEESELAGAMSSLSMICAAIVTTVIAPVYMPFLLWMTNR